MASGLALQRTSDFADQIRELRKKRHALSYQTESKQKQKMSWILEPVPLWTRSEHELDDISQRGFTGDVVVNCLKVLVAFLPANSLFCFVACRCDHTG